MRNQKLCYIVLVLNLVVAQMLAFRSGFFRKRHGISGGSSTQLSVFTPTNPLDISGSVISQLAEIAIKLRLADYTSVQCDVSSSSVLGGKIGPVTVKGRGWRSGRGLSCRLIEATVQSCELDFGRIISSQKLVLTRPAEGKAMIALNKEDFGNFITHPLMKPPQVVAGEAPTFLKENTAINAKEGTVVFFSKFRGHKWRCTLQRSPSASGTAKVTATLANPDTDVPRQIEEELTGSLTKFFNDMVYELDGTFLSYRDMMVTDKGSSPSIMLALNILVRKFPSPGIDF